MDITVIIFALVYLAMGLGHLPGLKIDRTGSAVLGAMLLIILGKIAPTAAWAAIDFNTIGLLFALMVVSSAFIVSGFYDWLAQYIGGLNVMPSTLLAILIAVSGVLSALLTNDVIMVTMTPILCGITLTRRLNPIPFLLGICFAANIGSAGTLIGSPKNMILSETMHLSFSQFSAITLLPTVLSLLVSWVVLAWFYRNRWQSAPMDSPEKPSSVLPPPKKLNRIETVKAGIITLALITAFIFTEWPHMLAAMAAASLLLLNRRISSSDMLKHVDGNLLLLLMGLFIVNAAMSATGLPQEAVNWLHHAGIDLHSPTQIFIISAVVSDLISNNPTVMLLTPFLADAGQIKILLAAAISMGASFSSNAVIFGSLAGIIVIEQAKLNGIKLGLGEFMRAGIPVTVITMALGIFWIYFLDLSGNYPF